jgi:hypothetical protein
METKRGDKLQLEQEGLETPSGSYPLLDGIRRRGEPLTRAHYLEVAGISEPVPAELEETLPPQFRTRAQPKLEDRLTPEQLALVDQGIVPPDLPENLKRALSAKLDEQMERPGETLED